MSEIRRAACEHEGEELWYSKLRKIVRMPRYLGPLLSDSSFREAMRTLKEVGRITEEKPSPTKKKKLLLYLVPEKDKRYAIPDSYSSKSHASPFDQVTDAFKLPIGKRYRNAEKRGKIIQSILFRANAGATYPRSVNESEIGPGQVIHFVDQKGNWYYNEYIEQNFSADQMKELIPVSREYDTIDGISVMDLVHRRDSGYDGVFRDLHLSVREVESAANLLVNKGYIVEMSRDEVFEAIRRTRKPARHEQLINERRYKVENNVLQEYLFDLNDLLYCIARRIRACRMTGHISKVDNVWYEYYYGVEALANLRTYQKTEIERVKIAGKDGVTQKATPFGITIKYRPRKKESYVKEIQECDRCIREKLDTLESKDGYAQIGNEYTLLGEILMKLKQYG
jgi:hypothetical protein